MFDSLLIANRGEIARRINRTAQRLGMRTVAVYSEADANAPHLREVDQAVLIGPAKASESYLVGAKIIDAAKKTGAAAIHPGYGFLSENADFADAVKKAGLIWVGPPASSIRAMGLKDAAKKLMQAAGVPVTPGYHGDDQAEATLKKEADKIGYPVLIKAVAGGGGKGMRRVDKAADFSAALESCRREAKSSFSDDRVLIEKYVTRPRHIEVQVFADTHGNAVYLFERDCSLQRRHQKVVEEAPAPGMDEKTRAALGEAAVKAAKAVKYEGAGTIEFIADGSQGLSADRIWFMEMNTRLQVEHPVTEMITGQDLVEWQLRVAAGEPLPLKQNELKIDGASMEVRLYAENPSTGFLPSTGPLTHFHLPSTVRVDTGVEAGGEVSSFYDPMIAKIITHGATREAAAVKLANACREVQIWPVKTNAAFLARLVSHPDFLAGNVDTGFIDARLDSLLTGEDIPKPVLQAAAQARLAETKADAADPDSPWAALTGFRASSAPVVEATFQAKDKLHRVALDLAHTGPHASATLRDHHVLVFHEGETYEFTAPDTSASAGSGAAASGNIISPMPGRVLAVRVKVGDKVAKGQALVTVEAMKMEHTLNAQLDAVVASVTVKEGDTVSEGATLVKLEVPEAKP